jgi:hypothetical protein
MADYGRGIGARRKRSLKVGADGIRVYGIRVIDWSKAD